MTGESVCAALIVLVLVVLALYFGRQQQQTLRWLGMQSSLTLEDRGYFRRQAWLRLVNCGLMLLLAALLGTYYLAYDAPVTALADRAQARNQRNEPAVVDAEELRLRRIFAAFCFAVLVLLMAIVFLVAADIWSIRRYGRRHLRKIDADRRAMIDDQVARLRSERNGHV